MPQCPRCFAPTPRVGYCPNCVEQRTHVNPVEQVKQFHIATNLGVDPRLLVVAQLAEFFGLPVNSVFNVYNVVIPADYCVYDLGVIGVSAGADPDTDPGGTLLVIGNNPPIEIPADRPYNLDRKSFPCFVGQTPIYIFPEVMPVEISAVDITWTIIYGDK